LKVINKNKNSVFELIEEDDDIENLTEGEKYYRIWSDGEFKIFEAPKVFEDGSIILPTDSLLSVSDQTGSNIKIKSDDKEKWDNFWKNHSVTQYIIKGGFEVIDDKEKS
tara:strand:- start:1131 stop:1457 length:327 start_codon:yes stop_codon:yes gene_type:complete